MKKETNQENKPLSPLVLRFHHLLCIPLFEGRGYSDNFSLNMAKIKQRLESSKENSKQSAVEKITFICDFDSVCENCPNKSEKGCLLNEEDREKIEDKDRYIAQLLGEKSGYFADYFTALNLARDKIDSNEFIKICGQCRWYKAGVCSFDKWKRNVEAISNR